jgi:NADH:ubiquinone oxidoreductase subunit 3 (subunit A)
MSGAWQSGWNVYYIVGLAAALALLIPLGLWAISRALSPRQKHEKSASLISSENPAAIGRKSNPRFFQAMSAAMILIALALLMIPCALAVGGSTLGAVCIFSLSAIAGLALLYGVRKHDLDWLRSFYSGGES